MVPESAEGGNPIAQGYVGDCYSQGIGTEADVDTAIMWHEKAASEGVCEVLFSLLDIYWGQYGLKYRNLQVAAKKLEDFYVIAPDDEIIQSLLAFVYYFGVGVKADKSRAMEVWPMLNELFSDDSSQVPIGIKEMGFFWCYGYKKINVDKDYKFESQVVHNLFLPFISTFFNAFLNVSYETYHLLLDNMGMYFNVSSMNSE